MLKTPLAASVLFGAILQIVMVVLGKLMPSLATGSFYPAVGTAIAALSGMRFSRWSPGATLGTSLSSGGLAGGGSSLIGTIAAVIAGAAPGAEIETIGIGTATGAVAGVIGGLLGRFLPKRSPVPGER